MSSNNQSGIRLADGTEWRMDFERSTEIWVNRFCEIIGAVDDIRASAPVIFYRQRESADLKNTPDDDTRFYDIGSLQFLINTLTSDIDCFIQDCRTVEEIIYSMWYSLHAIFYCQIAKQNFPLHAALVKRDGKGYLFAAPGGTGKSTLCSRLPDEWDVLSDDEAMIVNGADDNYRVHPLPTWSNFFRGKYPQKWKICDHVPLSKVFFIEQSEGDMVIPIGSGEAAGLVNQAGRQILRRSWSELEQRIKIDLSKRLFDNVCRMVKCVPCYRLKLSQSGNFWEVLDEIIV